MAVVSPIRGQGCVGLRGSIFAKSGSRGYDRTRPNRTNLYESIRATSLEG